MLISISAENSRPLLFGVVYHPPKLDYLALFQAEFKKLHPSYPMTVIVGDFNVDLNRIFHDSDSLIIDFCICNHLSFVLLFFVSFLTTHHTIFSHTCIEHCLVIMHSLNLSKANNLFLRSRPH